MSDIELSGPDESITDFVYAFASTSGGIFASCASGLYRSADAGQTWHAASESLRTALQLSGQVPTTAISRSPEFEHDQTLFTAVGGLVLRSEDAGEHWTASQLANPVAIISALAVSPAYERDGIVAAGTVEDGFFCSTDRGAHWTPWNFGLQDLSVSCLAVSPDFGQDETMFLGTQTGLFRSTNGGRAWREIPLPTAYSSVLSIAISPAIARDGVVFAGTENGILLKSSNAGESWQQIHAAPDTSISAIVLDVDCPGALRILLNTGSRLLLSPDDCTTWFEQDVEQSGGDVSAVIAPCGLDEGAPLVAGFVGGRIRCLRLSAAPS